MKKVLKKFNRTLSIMLAAAMVLTMVPSTAMPVLAANGDVVEEATLEETSEITEPATDEQPDADEDEGSDEEVVGATVEDPDSEDGEKKENENPSTEETPADPAESEEDADEDVVTDGDTETGSDEEQITENPSAEDETADEEVSEEEDSLSKIQPDALENKAATKILIKGTKTEEEEGKQVEKLADLEHAKVVFTNGCASDDGSEMRDNTDVTFRVIPDQGWKVSEVKYGTAATEAELDAPAKANGTPSGSIDGELTISKGSFTANNKNNKNVLLVVKVAEREYTVNATGATVQAVDGEGKLVAIPTYAYSKASEIKLAVTGLAAEKEYTVTAKIGKNDATTLDGTKVDAVTGDNTTPEYYAYTLNATTLAGFDADKDQTIDVTVAEVAAVTVATAEVKKDPAEWPGSVANATIATGKTGYTALDAANYAAGAKVAFQVTNHADWEAATVTAKLVDAMKAEGAADRLPDITTLEVKDAPEGDFTGLSETIKGYYVEIPSEVAAGYKLQLTVSSELKDSASKKITFTANPADKLGLLTIKGGVDEKSANKLETTTLKTQGNAYYVNISSKEGYRIQKAEITVNGEYTKEANKNETFNPYVYELEGTNVYEVAGTIDLKGDNTPDLKNPDGTPATPDGKTWVATSVDVVITLAEAVEGADEQKKVTFTSTVSATGGKEYEYDVKTFETKDENGKVTEKVEWNKTAANKQVTIAEGTQYLNFTVISESAPEITVEPDGKTADEDILETVSEAAGKYEYRIVAKALIGEAATIAINRPAKKITLKGDTTDVTIGYKNTETNRDGRVTHNMTVDVDAPLEITVMNDPGTAPIKSVTYKVGDAEKTAAPLVEGTEYFFSEKVSEDVEINVEKVADERLFMQQEGDEEPKEIAPNSTVDVDYDREISAWLADKNGDEIEIISASVKENGVLAETAATITDNVATLKVKKNEYGKKLTVTLLKKNGRDSVSFTIVSDEAVDGEVTFEENGVKVTEASLNADTRKKYQVKAEKGNEKKLAAALIDTPTTGAAPDKVPANAKEVGDEEAPAENKNISVSMDKGELTVTALPALDKADAAGTILIYEQSDVENKKVLGSLSVKVTAPLMKGVAADAEEGVHDGRNIAVQIKVSDDEKKEVLEAGTLGYEIKVKAPANPAKPADMADADWTKTKASMTKTLQDEGYTAGKFVELSKIVADGGHTIPVLAADVKPASISGFEITVTPVQYTSKVPAQMTAANKVSGTLATVTAGTTEPKYSDTLKLGKGEKTLTTGQDKDVVVATPEFAKDAKYKNVVVEIIDSTTNQEHYASWCDNAFVDDNGEPLAKWNAATGTVTVNAKKLTYEKNANGEYKNLAVKVTAFTETGDYGVSGVQKLSVGNGIQDIELTVQPEILFAGRKVTVKSAIDYNVDNRGGYDEKVVKKMAPKKKAVTYSIVGEGGTEASLGANMKAVVDKKGTKAVSVDKSGKITVAASFVPSKNPEDDTFYLKAVAADYEGNDTESAYLMSPVQIISKDTELGRLAIFKYNEQKNGYEEVPDGDIQADGSSYYLGVLKPSVPKKNTYNLDESGDGDVLAYSLFDIKSSNKNSISVNGSNGQITIKKLGKTNFTVAAKSNSKNKVEKKNVNFIMEKTDLWVEVKRYQDSTFEKEITAERKHYKSSDEIKINGNTTGYFSISPVKEVVDKEGNKTYLAFVLPNFAFSFKNAKKVEKFDQLKTDMTTYFVATGSTGNKASVVTVNNKGVKPAQKFTITISNATVPEGSAPKLAMTDKKQRIVAETGKKMVNITVTAAKKGEEIPANTYVMLSADQTKKTKIKNINNVFNGYLDTAILLDRTSDSTATFDVGMTNAGAESYTLIATLGTMEQGIFKQTHKEAKITLKAVKANQNIKVTASYTLNPFGISSQKMVVNGGDGPVEFADYANRDKDGLIEDFNYAKNQILKNNKPNEFNKYFKVTAKPGTEEPFMIMVNPDLKYEELQKLNGSSENKDFVKDNTTGYITVTNGYKKVDVKLTVKLKVQKDVKLKASATSVLEGSNVIADIQIMDGKTPVAIEKYEIVKAGNSFKAPYYTDAMKSNKEETAAEAERLANGIIRVQAESVKKGTDKIDVKVLLADTAANFKKQSTENADPFKTYGVEVKNVSISVKALTTANKVVLSDKKNGKNWIVKRNDWAATDKFNGWSTERKYTFSSKLGVPAGHTITISANDAPYVLFESDGYKTSGEQTLTIMLDKDKLKSAITDPKNKNKKVNWGKKITATAKFDYKTTDKDGNAVSTSIKEDTVKFSITLPEEEGFPGADGLDAEIDKKKSLFQNLADVKTKKWYQYYRYAKKPDGKAYTEAEYRQLTADAVAADLGAAARDLAKGTSAAILPKGDYKDGKFVYTLTVANKTPHTYYVLEDAPSIRNILDTITKTYGESGTMANADKIEELGLGYYNPTTDEASLEAKLREALGKKHLMTNNIILTVKKVDIEAPKAAKPGSLTAEVLVRDRNVEPNSWSESASADVYCHFDATGELSLYQANGDKGLATNLKATNNAKITELFGKAYTDSNGAIDENGELEEAMETALKKEIVEYAKTLIEPNAYLGVKNIDENSFACVPSGSPASSWTIGFKIVYTNGDPDADKAEFTETISELTVTKTNVPSIGQTSTSIKNDAEEAMEDANWLIKKVTSEADAITEIKNMIKAVVKDPKFDKENIDVRAADATAFVAPTDTVNGKIDVEVTYNKKAETPDWSNKYTFTIVKDDKLLGKDDKDQPNLDNHTKAVDLVKATLTPDKINAIVKGLWLDETKGGNRTTLNAAAVAVEIEKVATNAVKRDDLTGIAVVASSVDLTGTAEDVFKLPESTTVDGNVPAFKVELTDSKITETTEEWNTNKPKEVLFEKTALKAEACWQSKAEFVKELTDKLKDEGLPYTKDWIEPADNTQTLAVPESIKAEVQGTGKAIETAINNLITEYKKDEAIAKSPEWRKAAVTVTAPAANNASNTNYTPSEIKEVTLTVAGTAEANKIVVKLRGADATPTIIGVKITSIDKYPVAENGTVTIENKTEDLNLPLNVTVTGNAVTTDAEKKLTWKLTTDGSDETLPAGLMNGGKKLVDIVDKDTDAPKLFISKDAWTNETAKAVTVHITATIADATVLGETAKKTHDITVTIKLEEKVDKVLLLKEDGTANPLTSFQAGDADVLYTYSTKVTGSHIKGGVDAPTTKAVITWTGVAADDNITVENPSEGGADTSKVKLTVKPNAKTKKVTLTAKVGNVTKTLDKNEISITANADALKEAALDLESVDEAEWEKGEVAEETSEKKIGVLTVKNSEMHNVDVPITLSEGRTWSVSVALKAGKGAQLSADAEAAAKVISDNVSIVDGEGKNRNKKYLRISNALPEILEKAAPDTSDPKNPKPEVKPVILTLTAESVAVEGKGLAAITKKLDFEIIVNKTIKDIEISANVDDAGAAKVDDVKPVTKKADGNNTIVLSAKVVGAHVPDKEDVQKVTWTIEKNAGSKVTFDKKTNTLTIPKLSKDNIIKVTATSEADKTVKKTIKIKVLENSGGSVTP